MKLIIYFILALYAIIGINIAIILQNEIVYIGSIVYFLALTIEFLLFNNNSKVNKGEVKK